MWFRNSIPQFWLTPMVKVNWMKHKVFEVPAKRWIFHSNIVPWNVYAAHILKRRKLEQRIWLGLEVLKIPGMAILIWTLTKSKTKPFGIEICCILNFDLLPNLIFDHIPIFCFNFVINFLVLWPVYIIIDQFPLLAISWNSLKVCPLIFWSNGTPYDSFWSTWYLVGSVWSLVLSNEQVGL